MYYKKRKEKTSHLVNLEYRYVYIKAYDLKSTLLFIVCIQKKFIKLSQNIIHYSDIIPGTGK